MADHGRNYSWRRGILSNFQKQSQINTPNKNWRFWIGGLFSLIGLIWLIYTTNWTETWAAFAKMNYGFVLVAIAFNLVSIPLRTARWQLMFPPHNLPLFGKLTAIMLIGQTINIMFPGRFGDLARATLVDTERTAYVMGTLVLQSALDLLMMASLVIVLLFQVTLPIWWRGSGQSLLFITLMILLVIVGLIVGRRQALYLLTKVTHRWPHLYADHILALVEQFLRSFKIVQKPGVLILALIWSLLIWGVYGTVNYVLLQAVGEQPSLLIAFFLLVVLQLGVAVPSSPGRLGVFHYLSVQALAVFGIVEAQAVSYAIMLHLISVVMPIMLGGVLAWRMGIYLTPTLSKNGNLE